ncbi:PA2778 family cysteine peptidase [Mariprofundus sp. EBB-1]|uniref:PA2778 family cysteine peptidase n=1 Tax=Mariprofundus sp. EBB-1 TaxID=2650971 RepID=UPI001F293063|nr:PA2778 family cysteine peptidase [Mariprofundus sp. EBB-1]
MHIKFDHRTACMAGVICLMLIVSGCMPKQTATIMQDKSVVGSSKASVDGVPFYPQLDFQCGPASLAMALEHAGVEITPEQLRPALFVPKKRGSLQVEMLATPRRYGMLAYKLKPMMAALLQEVQAGHPVIVFQNLGLQMAPQWHYAVVTAFDLNQKSITLHSGDIANDVMAISTFERTWVRADSWAMLVLSAGDMPATANPNGYLTAVAMLEKEGFHRSAQQFYDAAITRWPESLAARIGSGNAHYALGKLNKAQQIYLQATLDFSDAAEAYNNLAQTYLDQKRYELAITAIHHAIALDSSSDLYHQTWSEIMQKKQSSPG